MSYQKKYKLRVGVIGLGVGLKHLEAFMTSKDAEVISVCDFDKFKLEKIKKAYPVIKVFKDENLIFKDESIDIVSIASFDNYHFSQIVKAYKYNKHILIEKPLCQNPTQLKIIYELFKKNKKIFFSSNLVLRTNHFFQTIKEELKRKKYGKLFHLEADYNWGRVQKIKSGWRSKMQFYSIIQGAGVHMIDLVIWLLNEKPIYVTAQENNIATKNSDLKYSSFALLLLQFRSGLTVKICANGGCVHPHFHSVRIFGTKKTMLHEYSKTLSIVNNNNKYYVSNLNPRYPDKISRKKLIHNFVMQIKQNKRKLLIETKDIFDSMSICFAAEKSIKNRKRIKIDYL